MDGTNGFTAVKQFTTPCEFCKRYQMICCASTTWKSAKCKACGVSKASVTFLSQLKHEVPWSGSIPPSRLMAPSGKSRLMVAVGIPSEQIVRAPRTSGGLAGITQAGSHESDFSARANLMKHQAALDLAQKEVEDAQEDLRNEVEPATQKRKECVR
ncbi:hypothetical protein PPACK8108_LOCUS346 [Phakopsora pachyrhizi]|uniref:Uncharacterized protein n=1 Tax=Phakopsora pachyrhizi TaxID=170000 RepID=A0AAV0AFS7_PHAPC|nr:hypothetical protein PPACK8108_LOCUS346 [Phakopsora pachyrhizi]